MLEWGSPRCIPTILSNDKEAMESLHNQIASAMTSKQWQSVYLTKGGTPLSHLFFADDLLFFGQVSFSQAKVMEHVLEEFCQISGQRINSNTSRVWLSPNTPSYLRNIICSSFGILATASLGKYLGVPLLHNRITKHTYHFLLDKIRRKLASWKMKLLSQATRMVLIKSTLAAIPLYVMQSVAIPKGTLGEIERLCRRFFWGGSDDQRRMHTLKWLIVCLPHEAGGLGIPNLGTMNHALLVKAGWRKLVPPSLLCNRILREKYGIWHQSRLAYSNYTYSTTWKAIRVATDLIHSGTRWHVSSGQDLGFWTDHWLADAPPCELISAPLHDEEKQHKVNQYWSETTGWDLTRLRGKLPEDVLTYLLDIQLSSDPLATDSPIWHPSPNGLFSVKLACSLQEPTTQRLQHSEWLPIWKFVGPQRPSFTLWLCLHGALSTNSFLYTRTLLGSPPCNWCSQSPQTAVHLFRDCPNSRRFWKLIVPPGWWYLFCRPNIVFD